VGPRIDVVRLNESVPLPTYAHSGDAGADLVTVEDVRLDPGQRKVVGTGLALAIPEGYVGLVHPRSGLAARTGLSIVNTPGTIDSGYRGEIQVCLINLDSDQAIELRAGDRIAQLLIQPVERAQFVFVEALDDTVRGAGGYGSSGGVAAWRTLEGQND
jgi:dUTP pyrophosphatase